MKQTVIDNLRDARRMLDEFEAKQVDKVVTAAQMLIGCYRQGGCVYLCGNGGSACDAQHISGELVGRYLINRQALAAVALTADTSILTCIGNDFSFEEVYSKQLEGLARQNDILWAFSCSGKSPNILKAAEMARKKEAKVIAFTGRDDTPLESLADLCIAVAAPYAGPAQQVHMVVYHTICQLVEEAMFGSGK